MVPYFAIFITCVVNIVLVSGQTYVCENSPKELSCPAGQVINISNVSYGRENATICSTNAISTANCSTQNATELFADICNGAQNCTIFFNGTDYLDSCPNVTKYFTVNYKCSNISVTPCGRHEHYSSFVCDFFNQCQTPDYVISNFCLTNGGCVCNLGYRKDPISGRCVGTPFCAQGNPNVTHEVFSECASRQPMCIGARVPRPTRCVPGYQCAPGYVREALSSQCIPPAECPRPFPRG